MCRDWPSRLGCGGVEAKAKSADAPCARECSCASATALWREEKLPLLDSIAIAKEEALTFLASERQRIMGFSREQAIREVLAGRKLDARVDAVESVSENGFAGDRRDGMNSGYLDKIIHADCREHLGRLDDGSIELLLSDIPYGIALDDWDVLHSNQNSALLGESPAQRGKPAFKRRGKSINGWSRSDRKTDGLLDSRP